MPEQQTQQRRSDSVDTGKGSERAARSVSPKVDADLKRAATLQKKGRQGKRREGSRDHNNGEPISISINSDDLENWDGETPQPISLQRVNGSVRNLNALLVPIASGRTAMAVLLAAQKQMTGEDLEATCHPQAEEANEPAWENNAASPKSEQRVVIKAGMVFYGRKPLCGMKIPNARKEKKNYSASKPLNRFLDQLTKKSGLSRIGYALAAVAEATEQGIVFTGENKNINGFTGKTKGAVEKFHLPDEILHRAQQLANKSDLKLSGYVRKAVETALHEQRTFQD